LIGFILFLQRKFAWISSLTVRSTRSLFGRFLAAAIDSRVLVVEVPSVSTLFRSVLADHWLLVGVFIGLGLVHIDLLLDRFWVPITIPAWPIDTLLIQLGVTHFQIGFGTISRVSSDPIVASQSPTDRCSTKR
jgi:hypothetical protein